MCHDTSFRGPHKIIFVGVTVWTRCVDINKFTHNAIFRESESLNSANISDKIAVTNKKDGFYANTPFFISFFCIFRLGFKFLSIFTLGQNDYIL